MTIHPLIPEPKVTTYPYTVRRRYLGRIQIKTFEPSVLDEICGRHFYIATTPDGYRAYSGSNHDEAKAALRLIATETTP